MKESNAAGGTILDVICGHEINNATLAVVEDTRPSASVELVPEARLCCGISIQRLPKQVQIAVIVICMLSFHLIFYMLEEMLFKRDEFNFPGAFTLFQCFAFSFYACLEQIFIYRQPRRGSLRLHTIIGFFTIAGYLCGLNALLHLNFPTWSLFKSSRMAAVMIGSVFILGRRFSIQEYLGALCILLGLTLFSIGDYDVSPSFEIKGIILVLMALAFNSFESNFQEKALKEFSISQNELMLYSNGIGALFLFPVLLFTEELQHSVLFLIDKPHVAQNLLLALLTSSFGMVFVIALIKTTDGVTTTMVTSIRKAMTVIISFCLFSKPWSPKYLVGGIIIAIGSALEIQAKATKKKLLVEMTKSEDPSSIISLDQVTKTNQ